MMHLKFYEPEVLLYIWKRKPHGQLCIFPKLIGLRDKKKIEIPKRTRETWVEKLIWFRNTRRHAQILTKYTKKKQKQGSTPNNRALKNIISMVWCYRKAEYPVDCMESKINFVVPYHTCQIQLLQGHSFGVTRRTDMFLKLLWKHWRPDQDWGNASGTKLNLLTFCFSLQRLRMTHEKLSTLLEPNHYLVRSKHSPRRVDSGTTKFIFYSYAFRETWLF